MSKHTPGPWSSRRADWAGNFLVHGKNKRKTLAETRQIDARIPGLAEANARLIAAAPDMFEALKIAKARLDLLEKQGRVRNGASINAINAALAKAEGRDE